MFRNTLYNRFVVGECYKLKFSLKITYLLSSQNESNFDKRLTNRTSRWESDSGVVYFLRRRFIICQFIKLHQQYDTVIIQNIMLQLLVFVQYLH